MVMRKFFAVMMLFSALLAPGFSQAAPLYSAGFLPGVDFAPTGMNNAGQIVGVAGTGADAIHTVLYAGGTLSDRGSMGGRDSYALAINDAGDLTGAVLSANGEEHAFLYQNGQATQLGSSTVGYGINDHGKIVGESRIADDMAAPTRPPYLVHQGVMSHLGALSGGANNGAVAINHRGHPAVQRRRA